MTTVSELNVDINGDASGLVGELNRAQSAVGGFASRAASLGASLNRAGASMMRTGRTATTHLTLPLVGLGVVAAKTAMTFDQTFSRIGALAGDIGIPLAQAKERVVDLAHATGQSAQTLGDALYFVASAGLEASKVMPVLQKSAQAAATGMGDASTVAQLLTTVLHDYAGSGLSAAKAMNILTGAIKVGKAEPADLAASLGTVIPVASQMGVSFQDVGAAIAQATNAGVSAERAVTGLRFLLASFQAPTDKALTVLKDFGISIGSLQQQLAQPGGLLKVMQGLADTFDLTSVKGKAAWNTITGGARGAIIANTLVGRSAESARVLWDAMGDSASRNSTLFQDAFKKMRGTDAFRAQRLLSDLKTALIELGEAVIPVFQKTIVPAIRSAIRWFQGLSDGAKSLIVKVGLVAAAFGPLMLIFGSLVRLAGGVIGAIARIAAGFGTVATSAGAAATATSGFLSPLGLIAGAAAVAAGGILAIKHANDLWNKSIEDTVGKLHRQRGAIERTTAVANQSPIYGHGPGAGGGQRNAIDKATEALDRYRARMETLVRAQDISDRGTEHWLKTLLKTHEVTDRQATKLSAFVGGLDRLGVALTGSDRRMVANLLTVGDFAGAMRILKRRLDETSGDYPVRVKTSADTAALDAMKNKLLGMGFRQAGGEWVASGAMRVRVVGGSPMPAVQIQQRIVDPMLAAGFRRTGGGGHGGGGSAWTMLVDIAVELRSAGRSLDRVMEALRSSTRDINKGLLEQGRDLERRFNRAEKALDRLRDRYRSFRSDIKAGFDELKDLPGALVSAWSTYQSAMETWTPESGEAMPTAPDYAVIVADMVAQAQRLAKDLAAAAKAGLSKGLVAQFAGQGPAAIPVLEQLLANPALIAQLNAASDAIAQAANQTASQLGERYFGKAIERAARRVDHLSEAIERFVDRLHRLFGDNLAGLREDPTAPSGTTGAGGRGNGGGGGNGTKPDEYHFHFPNYVGSKEELARVARAEFSKVIRDNGSLGVGGI